MSRQAVLLSLRLPGRARPRERSADLAPELQHIIFTLYDLGLHWTLKPQYWNQLVCGNVVITAGLFLVRALWFAGVGRKTTVIKSKSE